MGSAMAIGAIAGLIVVLSDMFFDRIKIDDPVGAISVHLVCGIWGTLAVGIFGAKAGLGQFVNQLIGVGAYGLTTVGSAAAIFAVLRATVGIRVSAEEEIEGLDLSEHGMHAYDYPVASGGGLLDDIGTPKAAAAAAAAAATLATNEG